MDRNLTRSISGTAGFSASSKTRVLKNNQESSRLNNRDGLLGFKEAALFKQKDAVL